MTSQKPILQNGGEQLTLFQVDSLVSPIQAQESEKAKRMNAIYGPKCSEQYARLNQVTLWAKTFAALLIGTGEWYSMRCKLIWSLRGTKSRPFLYLRRVSMPHTAVIEFGLLPTPTAMQDKADPKKVDARNAKQIAMGNQPFILGLSQMAMRGMLPTPMANDIHHPERVKALKETGAETMSSRKNGANRPNGLMDYLDFNQMLPTPAASDYNARGNQPNWKGDDLVSTVHKATNQPGTISHLNPRFVAEMMGFPVNWTELPFQSGETNQSKLTETP